MAESARTYTILKKEKTLEELSEFSKQLTERYATSELEYSQEDVARDNNITRGCLRRLMDDAIIEARVSIEIALLVKNKAMKKSEMKVQQAGGRSISHHEDLMKKREAYLLTAFSRVETKKIAEDIANHPSEPISSFTRKYDIETDRLTKLLLKKAIVENIVSDEVMEMIIKRSLGSNPNERAKKTFEKFRIEREEYKKENSQ